MMHPRFYTTGKIKPHPRLIQNRSNKTKSRLWEKIFLSVEKLDDDAKFVDLWSVVQLAKNWKVWTRTLHKYIGDNILQDIEATNNKKSIILHEQDIKNVKVVIAIHNRFKWLLPREKKIIKYLFMYLWQTL